MIKGGPIGMTNMIRLKSIVDPQEECGAFKSMLSECGQPLTEDGLDIQGGQNRVGSESLDIYLIPTGPVLDKGSDSEFLCEIPDIVDDM